MARKKRIEHHGIVRTFAARLREIRKARGLSQMDLAFKAGANIGYIGKLERSEAAPGLDMVGRMAEALGVRPEKLIAGTGEKVSALPVVRNQLQRQVRRLLAREDAQALQAVAVVVGLVDNALARRNG